MTIASERAAAAIRGVSIRWWDTPEPAVGIEGFGLFGALVLRIAAGIARASRWVACAEPGCANAARVHGRTKHGPYCADHKYRADADVKRVWRAELRREAEALGVPEEEVLRRRAEATARKRAKTPIDTNRDTNRPSTP